MASNFILALFFLFILVRTTSGLAHSCQLMFYPVAVSNKLRIIDQCHTDACWLATEISFMEQASYNQGLLVEIDFERTFLRVLYERYLLEFNNKEGYPLTREFPLEQTTALIHKAGVVPQVDRPLNLIKDDVRRAYEILNRSIISNLIFKNYEQFISELFPNESIESHLNTISFGGFDYNSPQDFFNSFPGFRTIKNLRVLDYSPIQFHSLSEKRQFETLVERSVRRFWLPVRIAIDSNQKQISGPLMISKSDGLSSQFGHGLLLVDIVKDQNDEVVGFIVKNSWGMKTGIGGYFLMTKEDFYRAAYLSRIPSF